MMLLREGLEKKNKFPFQKDYSGVTGETGRIEAGKLGVDRESLGGKSGTPFIEKI